MVAHPAAVCFAAQGADEKDGVFSARQAFVQKATSNKAFHYRGSAKFFLLTGDAMARSLASLMAGGKPTIHEEVTAAE